MTLPYNYEHINEIGFIQEEGYLLVIRRYDADLKIVGYSENFITSPLSKLSRADNNIWDRSLDEVLDTETVRQIVDHINSLVMTQSFTSTGFNKRYIRTMCSYKSKAEEFGKCSAVPRDIYFCGCLSRCSSNPNDFLVEFEEVEHSHVQTPYLSTSFIQSGELTARINRGTTTQEVASTFCDAILDLIGEGL
jgi:hypothetical protein